MDRIKLLYDQLLEHWERERKHVRGSSILRIGPWRYRVEGNNPSSTELYLKALAHLADSSDSAEIDFEIKLFDYAEAKLVIPDVAFLKQSSERKRVAQHTSEGDLVAALEGQHTLLSIIDYSARTAFVVMSSIRQLENYQLACPFRTIFHWLSCRKGYQLIHASAVGIDGAAIVLAAPAGSGKSISALACLNAGQSFLGDDFVMVGPIDKNEEDVQVFSLYNSTRISPQMRRYFELLAPARQTASDRKDLFYLYPQFASQIVRCLALATVAVPEPVQRTQNMQTLGSREVAQKVILPTLSYLPGYEADTTKNLVSMLQKFPAYTFDSMASIDAIGGNLREILCQVKQ